MTTKQKNDVILEIALIIVVVGLTSVMHQLAGFRLVVLNLYFLPVLLSAFFLGRYRAGVLALLSVVLVTIVAAQDFTQFDASGSPLTTALAITIWGGVLGLTTILAGTLSDERTTQMTELHEAYIGVIEVLSKYLHSVHPQLRDRPLRIAELCQRLGTQMRLPMREIDDIRVASLLQEMDHIEITARVVRKAIGNMDSDGPHAAECTFHGSDLVQSLGAVINGALPLLRQFDETATGVDDCLTVEGNAKPPLGAQIIRTARTYDRLVFGKNPDDLATPARVLADLKAGLHGNHLPDVLHALDYVVLHHSKEGNAKSAPVMPSKSAPATSYTSTAS